MTSKLSNISKNTTTLNTAVSWKNFIIISPKLAVYLTNVHTFITKKFLRTNFGNSCSVLCNIIFPYDVLSLSKYNFYQIYFCIKNYEIF